MRHLIRPKANTGEERLTDASFHRRILGPLVFHVVALTLSSSNGHALGESELPIFLHAIHLRVLWSLRHRGPECDNDGLLADEAAGALYSSLTRSTCADSQGQLLRLHSLSTAATGCFVEQSLVAIAFEILVGQSASPVHTCSDSAETWSYS